MAFAFVQSQNNGNASSTATTRAVTVTALSAGNIVVGIVTWGSGTSTDLTSVTDGTNTYTIVRRVADTTNGQSAAVFYAYNVAAGATTITANFGVTLTYTGISVMEFSGEDTSAPPLDGANEQGRVHTGVIGSTTSGAGNLTPSANNYLVWAGSANTGATNIAGTSEFVAGTNFTEPANAEHAAIGDISLSAEYWIQTTATATNGPMTVTQNTDHITFMMVFKLAGATDTLFGQALT